MTADSPLALPVDPLSELRVAQRPAVPTVVVRRDGERMDRLHELFDGVFTRLPGALAEAGIPLAGPAVALYRSTPGETVDLEVGFPVAHAAGDRVDLGDGWEAAASELPAGRQAAISHLGGYEGLAGAWEAFFGRVAEAGERPGLPFWEIYVTQPRPEMDPADLRTDLVTMLD